MSSLPPKHSLSSPTSGNSPAHILPTPSSSTSGSTRPNHVDQLRRELEQQLAEKEKLLQEANSGIGKNVLARQISQLQERLREMDKAQQTPAKPLLGDDLPPATLEKLRNLERDLNALPSPSNSTLLPPDPSSLLPLPPPPTGSTPTKRRSKVPNNDRRNTDIEFATEIGQGLLLEVRKMQALLQEKEEQLRALEIQKADLERTAEAMAKQLRQREENEEKLKEETWNLELAKQELTVSVTDLQQNLNKANSEQNKLSKQLNELRTEIEQLRDREEKLSATIDAMKTRHEHDMSAIRRHAAGLQREKADQTKQIEALTSELAIAKAQSRIAKHTQSDQQSPTCSEMSEDQMQDTLAVKKALTPNVSPPPSPKQTPTRNQALEVETLKTSLAHAHRMVSNLRSNLHKEKTEKFEFKKLLAESQEIIEQLQNDPRMWEDAGHARSGAGASHEHGTGSAAQRRARKNKRRTAARKPRGLVRQKGEEDYSDADFRRRRKDSQFDNDSVYSYSSMSEEESEVSSESENERDHTMSKSLSASLAAAGFTPLSSELSQCQPKKPILVDAQVNTDPIDFSASSTASSRVIDANVPGSDMGTQAYGTNSESLAADNVALQAHDTDRVAAFESFSVFNFDIVPTKRCDSEVQCTQNDVAHAGVQTATATYVDEGTQSEQPITVHAETQSNIAISEHKETQCVLASGVDRSCQSELLITNNTASQTESSLIPDTVRVVVQTEPMDTQTEKDNVSEKPATTGVEVGVQTTTERELENAGFLTAAAGALGVGALAVKGSRMLNSVQDEERSPSDGLHSNLSSYKTAQEENVVDDGAMYTLPREAKAPVSRDDTTQLQSCTPDRGIASTDKRPETDPSDCPESSSLAFNDSALKDNSGHKTQHAPKIVEETFTRSDVDIMVAAAVAEAVAKVQEEHAAYNRSRELSAGGTGPILAGENDSTQSQQDPPPRPAGPPPASLLCKAGFATNSNLVEDRSVASSSISKGRSLTFTEMDDKTSSGFGMASVHTKKADDKHMSGSVSSLSTINTNEQRHSVSSLHLDGAAKGQSNVDSSMIQLVTQTMIGDWLWKYTRKTVGNGLSERRHQRFFWIHPYTRTLYWSTRIPGEDGKETKAKSALIEKVSVISDDSQSPSGLPNVSLLIQTGSRQIKVTAPDMARHELWCESLKYLIARAGADGNVDKPTIARSTSASLPKRPSCQEVFQHGHSGIESESGFDPNSDDEELEDVRMCCDGKHHVSRLEKDHLHRHTYRKRKSRNPVH
ncbi:hypothetical protein EC973_008295 [Apophysomyces ossiformis]|uniref:PH domain-containing protein n=1 Tax=Apophysomyces ossiformis TaxID=679940 RepID=A0A8H7C0I6_9FUNG|nr:hypothetical protein EC973_008295 [Apophysomyces ossiformis]